MKITDDNTREVRYYTRNIAFSGAEPILLERNYSHGGKRFIPDVAGCRWNHGEAIKEIVVSGNVLKKDGTPGNVRATLDYITPSHTMWGRHSDFYNAAPAWLLELFEIDYILDQEAGK